jgi:hypothetical protein
MENQSETPAQPAAPTRFHTEVVTEEVVAPSTPAVTAMPPTSPIPDIYSEPSQDKKGEWGWVGVVAFFILGIVVGGIAGYVIGDLLANRPKTENIKQEVVVVSPTTAIPTGTPKIIVSRDDLKVQVLNGSGVSGAASATKEYLEGLGYQGVVIGNADSDAYTGFTYSLKTSKQDFADLLKKDLISKYSTVGSAKVLDSFSDYDVVIILGK